MYRARRIRREFGETRQKGMLNYLRCRVFVFMNQRIREPSGSSMSEEGP